MGQFFNRNIRREALLATVLPTAGRAELLSSEA